MEIGEIKEIALVDDIQELESETNLQFRKIDNKINDVRDELFQSGVESNKILVDGLNSKGVSATVNDSIKKNVDKVKYIEVGDYSVGDVLDIDNIAIIPHPDYPRPVGSSFDDVIWRFSGHTDSVNAVSVSKDNYVCSGSDDEKVMMLSPDGHKIWEYDAGYYLRSVVIGNDNCINTLTNHNMQKLNPQGEKLWSFRTGRTNRSLAVDKDNYVYVGADGYGILNKISPDGDKVWGTTTSRGTTRDVNAIAVGKDGYVYIANDGGEVKKINPTNGKIRWTYDSELGVLRAIAVDKDNYIYVGGYNEHLVKLSSSGKKVWEYTEKNSSIRSIAVSQDNYVYIGYDYDIVKISPNGETIWEFDGDGYIDSVVISQYGYVYAGDNRDVVKINPSLVDGCKIIK